MPLFKLSNHYHDYTYFRQVLNIKSFHYRYFKADQNGLAYLIYFQVFLSEYLTVGISNLSVIKISFASTLHNVAIHMLPLHVSVTLSITQLLFFSRLSLLYLYLYSNFNL